ncbi:class I SAM-dependent methyltransferase [Actinomycetospora sp. CA-053990]|uniref:class I SAM-dependent methyltransferase n=1 Tax=Actinomycetospora sp. CA-053990 TaxID=3239891 RepID=UPI003D910FF1
MTHPDLSARIDPVATTARLTAASRARDSRRADRLVDDPLASVLAGAQGEEMLAQAEAGDVIPVRTRWFDDRLRAAVASGVDQVVLVAAGMDTRAWRLGLGPTTLLVEVDRPELLALKADLLATAPPPDATRVPVGADLTTAWDDDVLAAGIDPARPVCWVVEGLLQYLAADDVDRLLDRITALSAPGSHLLIDVVGQALLDLLAPTPMLARFARLGMPWVFGSDDPAGLVAGRGWTSEVHLFGEVAVASGRSSLAPPGGPDGYLVHATR